MTVKRGGETVAAGTVTFDCAAARFWQLGVRVFSMAGDRLTPLVLDA